MEKLSVTLDIPVGEGKPTFPWTYEKFKAETAAEVQQISRDIAAEDETLKTDDDRKKAATAYLVKAFNYGHDLLLRASERSKGARAAQGPEKEIAKGVKALMDNGFDAETAMGIIKAQREATGKPV